jgi:uncharacterized protein YprB with RNaseH-like and TPR domain
MKTMTKKNIEAYLIEKKGYLKKSAIEVAKAMWKLSPKHIHPKTKKELEKELAIIKEVQTDLRRAISLETEVVDTRLTDIYHQVIAYKNRPKRKIFFDIETSPNVVFSWRIGNKVNLSHDNIINERAIICICYKWDDEDVVHSLKWNKGDDKEMLKKFAKIIDSADEVIGQNSDKFDLKWLRTRCILHDIPISNKFNSIDTLKMARAGFNFNSNKLDYMGSYLGLGKKLSTGYDLWTKIVLHNDSKAMEDMITYCKQDVALLEKVYEKLQKFSPTKKFKYKL